MGGKKILIKWDKSYELGIEIIDEQHKKLVDIISNFYNAFATSQEHEKIGTVINELVNYTIFHFIAEEEMFKNSSYPDVENHIKKHVEFTENLKNYQKEVSNGNLTTSYDMVTYLRDWLIQHIMKTDTTYLPYL
jgi:hemerythrin-like metal-binding protein